MAQMQQRVQTRLTARRRREAEEARVAAGIAAEEQKFEAIKQRFGLDAAGIIGALTLWQEHGDDIIAWREANQASDGAAKGVPLRQHATNAGLQQTAWLICLCMTCLVLCGTTACKVFRQGWTG
jgi:hypothetical protein